MGKKLIITISTIVLGLNLIAAAVAMSLTPLPVSYAEDDLSEATGDSLSEATGDSLSEATFDIRTILKLPDSNGNSDQPQKYFTDPKYSPLVALIIRIIDFATRIIGSIAIILFIVSGLMFMLSTGNQQRLDKAKEIVTYAIIGLIVTFFSYIIAIFVQSIFIPSTPPADTAPAEATP